MNRRAFFQGAAISGIAAATVSYRKFVSTAHAQQPMTGANGAVMDMDQSSVKPVRLPSKPNAAPQLTNDERDALEHQLRCQCGCNLDVYTCRTTDFSCQVSPAMHRDVMSLVAGGYTANEIKEAFKAVYGEVVFMAPVKEGFNWVGYILPFAVLGTGAIFVSAWIKRWSRPQPTASDTSVAASLAAHPNATPEEMERLRQALRNDDE